MPLIGKLLDWGPVFFGVLLFAPMWAAALDALGFTLPLSIPNLAATLALGLCWGLYAKLRQRWL